MNDIRENLGVNNLNVSILCKKHLLSLCYGKDNANEYDISSYNKTDKLCFLFAIVTFIESPRCIELLKYYHDKLNVHAIHKQNKYNCFLQACYYNTDIDVIKYIVDELGAQIEHKNVYGEDAFLVACYNNSNIKIIKYLARKLGTKCIDNDKRNCFLLACAHNENVNVIKYIVDNLNVNKFSTDDRGNNAVMLACENKNIDVLKYLVEELNMSIIQKNNNKENLLTYASVNNRQDICEYLLNKDMVYLQLDKIGVEYVVDILKKNKKKTKIIVEKMDNVVKYKRMFIDLVKSNKMIINIVQCDLLDLFNIMQ